MHGRPFRRGARRVRAVRPLHPTGAVTWIDAGHAIVARSQDGGARITTVEAEPGAGSPDLAKVVDAIGDPDRILILGPDAMRVELEREYVAIHRRPERLLDVERDERHDEATLVRRLRELTSA